MYFWYTCDLFWYLGCIHYNLLPSHYSSHKLYNCNICTVNICAIMYFSHFVWVRAKFGPRHVSLVTLWAIYIVGLCYKQNLVNNK